MNNVADEMRRSDFKLMEFELSFGGREADLPAVSVEREDISLRLVGKVDRVDGWVKDGKLYLRVVDYKTGRKSFSLSDVQYGLGIQMLLYLFALEREGEKHFGMPVVPSGVLYLPARDVIVSEKRDASPAKIESDIQKELRLQRPGAGGCPGAPGHGARCPGKAGVSAYYPEKGRYHHRRRGHGPRAGPFGPVHGASAGADCRGAGPGQRGRRPGLPHTPGRRMPVVCLCIRLAISVPAAARTAAAS